MQRLIKAIKAVGGLDKFTKLVVEEQQSAAGLLTEEAGIYLVVQKIEDKLKSKGIVENL